MHYHEHLAKDEHLKKLLASHGPFTLSPRKDIHFYLIASIMSQQLSTKVANSIRQRFLALYDDRIPTPAEILATPAETLRSIGLSNAKVSYVMNVARFAIEKGMDDQELIGMDDQAIIEYLTQIKGVGRWTVEMLLMFSLGREDIFAIDDWGLQNAMIHLYNLDRSDKKAFRAELLRISAQWSPYRTFACMLLWRWKDNTPDAVKAPAGKKAVAGKAAARSAKATPKKAAKKAAPKKKAAAGKAVVRSAKAAKKNAAPPKKKATKKAAPRKKSAAPKKNAAPPKKSRAAKK